MAQAEISSVARLWSTEELAAHLGVPVQTVYIWRTKNKGPRASRVGRFIRFDPADVAAWLEQHKDPAA